jgi:hypothetical protein
MNGIEFDARGQPKNRNNVYKERKNEKKEIRLCMKTPRVLLGRRVYLYLSTGVATHVWREAGSTRIETRTRCMNARDWLPFPKIG